MVIAVTGRTARFVRGHIPLRYLAALTDPSRALEDTFNFEQSPELNLMDYSDRVQLMIALTAILDEYFLEIRPTLSKYSPLEPEDFQTRSRSRSSEQNESPPIHNPNGISLCKMSQKAMRQSFQALDALSTQEAAA